MQVEYDEHSFVIDGQRRLLVSGEIHYSRSARESWPALLDRSIACGINCIATYIFWNVHEPERSRFDFSGDGDLAHYLSLCAERDLLVLLRMGPYCCAEWNFGGFPAWIAEEPGIVIRTSNMPYMRRVEAYFTRLCDEVRPFLATQGGPIIACQVENEYANVAARYGDDGQRYLAWMADLAKRLGIDVPIIMCEGGAPGAIDTVNGFSISDQRLSEFRAKHPQLPILWTEFWPGWYETWGFQEHLRDPRNMAVHLLRFVARGGSGWNYYMWHAGTNFGRTSMYLQATHYGFDAPLDEFGRATVKAAYLSRLHHLLISHQEILLNAERRTARTTDGEEISWTFGRTEMRLHLGYRRATLTSSTAGLLFDSEVAYTDALANQPAYAWETHFVLNSWDYRREPRPGQRRDAIRAPQPIGQLPLTRDLSDYCWYSTRLDVAISGDVTLDIPAGGDLLYVYLNDVLVAQTAAPFRENRGPTEPRAAAAPANDLEKQVFDGFHQTFTWACIHGQHKLDILAVSLGLVKGDWMISGPMNTERKGIWSGVTANGQLLMDWSMHPGLHGEVHPGEAWQSPPAPVHPLTWYRTAFTLTETELAADADVRLDAAGLGKGMLFLNGHHVGRYWLIAGEGYGADQGWQDAEVDGLFLGPAGGPTQRYYHLPHAWLGEQNTIVLFEEQAVRPERLTIERRTFMAT